MKKRRKFLVKKNVGFSISEKYVYGKRGVEDAIKELDNFNRYWCVRRFLIIQEIHD
ncbi:hypothetical protein [uncultured Mediterranean phage uvMED]|nr:hypothetical protein [uncultured Mediterranean phage uvMED]